MNHAQLAKFHVLKSQWEKARKAAGRPADAAALSALKLRTIKRDVSSKLFSQRDLDAMVAAFQAEISPGDFDAQMRQQNQPDARRAAALVRCRAACDALSDFSQYARLDKPAAQDLYLDGVAMKLTGHTIGECTVPELEKTAGVIGAHARRLGESLSQHSASVMAAYQAPKMLVPGEDF